MSGCARFVLPDDKGASGPKNINFLNRNFSSISSICRFIARSLPDSTGLWYGIITHCRLQPSQLAAAFPELNNLEVAQVFFDMVFLGVAVGAHQLHGAVTDHLRDIAGIDLGPASLSHQEGFARIAELLPVEHGGDAQIISPGAFDSDGHVGDHGGLELSLI